MATDFPRTSCRVRLVCVACTPIVDLGDPEGSQTPTVRDSVCLRCVGVHPRPVIACTPNPPRAQVHAVLCSSFALTKRNGFSIDFVLSARAPPPLVIKYCLQLSEHALHPERDARIPTFAPPQLHPHPTFNTFRGSQRNNFETTSTSTHT